MTKDASWSASQRNAARETIPSDPMITIDGDTISIHSSGMGMKVEKKRVHIGKAGTNMSVSDSGNIFVKGSVIKLG